MTGPLLDSEEIKPRSISHYRITKCKRKKRSRVEKKERVVMTMKMDGKYFQRKSLES
ncbi:hypothetical protein Goari_006191 [Gossypium aridum]|uniref:Uncharacterized protein n=1 Tax=Gossypium aridum TaxID=34290 RepID=A0A7J8XNU2_GOSAI|nr:hypothetical protein [Gossypium aridum]